MGEKPLRFKQTNFFRGELFARHTEKRQIAKEQKSEIAKKCCFSLVPQSVALEANSTQSAEPAEFTDPSVCGLCASVWNFVSFKIAKFMSGIATPILHHSRTFSRRVQD